MRRIISSELTLIYKVVFPLAVMVALGLSTPGLARGRPGDFVYSGVWMAALGFVYWFGGRLKHVAVDGTDLYISNYLREIRVPLSSVTDITENRWLNIRPVRIRFDVKTPFGNGIVFMPRVSLVSTFRPHPIVADLKALVARRKETEAQNANTA